MLAQVGSQEIDLPIDELLVRALRVLDAVVHDRLAQLAGVPRPIRTQPRAFGPVGRQLIAARADEVDGTRPDLEPLDDELETAAHESARQAAES